MGRDGQERPQTSRRRLHQRTTVAEVQIGRLRKFRRHRWATYGQPDGILCVSNKVVIRSFDVSNAYLQGVPVNRIILYKIPRGGIPEEDVPDGAVIAARVPIYGTRDAGRGFWLKLKEIVTESGFILNKNPERIFHVPEPGRRNPGCYEHECRRCVVRIQTPG